MGQLDVEPSDLRAASKKIRDAVSASDKVKLKNLGDVRDDFGHDDAAKEFKQLMATWAEAIKSPLKEDGDSSADKLNDNAKAYERAEEQSKNHFSGPEVAGPGPVH